MVYKNGYAIDRCAATGLRAPLGSTSSSIAATATTAAAAPSPACTTSLAPHALPLTGVPPPPTTYQASFGGTGAGGGTINSTIDHHQAYCDGASTIGMAPPPPPPPTLAATETTPPTMTTTSPNPYLSPQPVISRTNELAQYAEARLGKPSHLLDGGGAALGRFLSHGGKVLRFSARWDDASARAFGDASRRFVLSAHLEDDTIEIVEVAAASSVGGPGGGGSAAAAAALGSTAAATTTPSSAPIAAGAPAVCPGPGGNVFLRRAPLPKPMGANGLAPLHLLSARRAAPRHLFVTADDLRVGGEVFVHGRRFVLTGCDEATRAHYRAAMGLHPGGEEDGSLFGGSLLPPAADALEQASSSPSSSSSCPRPLLPPHNGIGAPEDTLQNCLHLIPRRPPKDMVRLMNKDGVALVFECVLAGSAAKAEEAEQAAAEARRASAACSTGASGLPLYSGGGGGGANTWGSNSSSSSTVATLSAAFSAKASLSSSSPSLAAAKPVPKVLAAAASEAAARAAAARTTAGRRFVMTYFYADNTIAIQERPIPNSGVPGGRFLERGVVRRPAAASAAEGSGGVGGGVGEPLTHSDLFVGAVIPVHGRAFELVGADTFTLDYMEQNSSMFMAADARGAAAAVRAQLLLQHGGDAAAAEEMLREALAAEAEDEEDGQKRVSDAQLQRALGQRLGVSCVAHQAIALRRAADPEKKGAATVDALVRCLMK